MFNLNMFLYEFQTKLVGSAETISEKLNYFNELETLSQVNCVVFFVLFVIYKTYFT